MSDSLHELLGTVAFPDTPEERDTAWNAIEAMVKDANAERAGAIQQAAAVGWDAAVTAMKYEDGTPVELAANVNPYRT